MDASYTYCAVPSRLRSQTRQIINFVRSQGHCAFHPFAVFPLEFFGDEGIFGREKALGICMKAIEMTEQTYLFGISDGTLRETVRSLELGHPVHLHMDKFDPEWKRYYDLLGPKYKNPIGHLLVR